MDDNDDFDLVPNAPSNITNPFQPTNVLNDAISIILCGLAFFAIVALNIGAGFLNYWLIGFVSSLLGINHRNDEAQTLTAVNGIICGAVVFFTSLGCIMYGVLLLVELAVFGIVGLCSSCAEAKRKKRQDGVELGPLAAAV